MIVVLGKKMKHASKKSLMARSQMLAKLQETMAGLKVVKVYNQQKYEEAAFRNINARLLKQLLKISRTDAATAPILEVLGMLAGAVAIVIGASGLQAKRWTAPSLWCFWDYWAAQRHRREEQATFGIKFRKQTPLQKEFSE